MSVLRKEKDDRSIYDEEHGCMYTGELIAELAEILGGVGVGESNACWGVDEQEVGLLVP